MPLIPTYHEPEEFNRDVQKRIELLETRLMGVAAVANAATWNLPWGLIGTVTYGTNQNVSSTTYVNLTNLTLTLNLVNGRRYLFGLRAVAVSFLQAADNSFQLELYNSTDAVSIAAISSELLRTTDIRQVQRDYIYTATATATKTIRPRMKVSGGTLTINSTDYPSQFYCIDIGPQTAI